MTPPTLAERLLNRRLRHDAWRDVTLGDLREEFNTLAARVGPARARRWYWRETFILVTTRQTRIHHPASGKDPLMRTLLSETRLAFRQLRHQPLLSLVVVLTMAVGLGANAATFGMIDALLLRPFTIPTVDRLVVLSEVSAESPFAQESVAPGNYLDLKRQTGGAISRMSTVSWWDVNMSGGDRPERLQGSQVGADFFTMLGVAPDAGRFFQPADEAVGAPRTVVISDSLWRRRFAAAGDVVGSSIQLDGHPYTVVGRAPAAFDFPNGSDIWTPLVLSADEQTGRVARFLTVIGELDANATVAAAQAEMTAAYARLKEAHPENRPYTLTVQTFTSGMVDFGIPRILGLWQAAGLLLLLIAGTNVASLFLARGAERQREIAVRLAIGASRWQLVRQLLIESLVLSVVAIPAALMMAWVSLQLISGLIPAELIRFLPGWTAMGISPRVAATTAAIALMSSVIFGLLPALRTSRPSLTSSLKDGGRSSTSGLGRSRLRRGLVVAEIALALPLLLSAGLAAVAGHRMASGPQGYDPDGLVRVRMSLTEATYPDAAARRQFMTRLMAAASAAPGISAVSSTSVAPATTSNQRRRVVVDGRTPPPEGPALINYRAVSETFHDVLHIPILQGRGFTTHDRDGTERVAVISESLSRLYWPDASPLGRRVKLSPTATEWITVVGISGNVLDDWFNSRNAPTIYVPVDQWPSSEVHLLARGTGDATSQIAALREAVRVTDPTLPIFNTETMRTAIHTRTSGLRFISQLMAAFGVLALLLASAGIYGVMANYVAQRRHEIGVRMALGATSQSVLHLTLGQGLKLSTVGILIGTALGLALAKLMENALFGVVALEASLFVAGPIILAVVALVATVVPARAAMRVDPAQVLRD